MFSGSFCDWRNESISNKQTIVMNEILPFCFELRYRIKEKTGLEWTHEKHSGADTWLAKAISVSNMSAGRYLRGRAIPIPEIARRISMALAWDYAEMVESIIEIEKTNIELKIMVRYSK